MKKDKFPTRIAMILYFLKGSKKYFAVSILFATLVSLFDLINPKIISFTVDSVLNSDPYHLPSFLEGWLVQIGGVDALRSHLWWIAIVIISVALVGAFLRFMFNYYNAKGAETLVETMRNTLFTHIEHLPFAWFGENHTGDIIQRCTSDVEQIKSFLSEQLTRLFRVFVLIGLALYFMFNINGKLAIATVLFIPIIVGYSLFFHGRIGDAFEKVDIEEGKLSSIAQENLTGVRVVRAFGRESYERQRFETQNEYYTGMSVNLMRLMGGFWASSDLFSYLQILTVLAYGAVLSVNGELSAGNYIAFISYTNMLMWPIRSLGRVISNLSKAGISIDRLMYIMNAEEEKDLDGSIEVDMNQDIRFNNVSYQYENGHVDVLEGINFVIPHGTTFGILGGTGSGKSTLMYLLDRLYELDENSGSITIGDTDIRHIKMSYLRSQIGMVLQEPYLFSRTLEENIRIASPQADRNEVRRVSKIASLDDAIEHFNQGYETYVGERGVTLSGGQKQRTAIAQTLIRKPPIMIFDDSLSAVDAETDAKIRQGLKENAGNSTIILIAHRITTLMHADHIIVMDQGKIVEHGTHDELLAQNGMYRKIYDLQFQQSQEGE